MKYIKPINEFFDFLRKDDDEDKIALDFLKRIEKAYKSDKNPYEIKEIEKRDWPDSLLSYGRVYSVKFDDVELISAFGSSFGPGGMGSDKYALMIDGEDLICKISYSKKIFNLVNEMYQRDLKRDKLDRLKYNINPAADLL